MVRSTKRRAPSGPVSKWPWIGLVLTLLSPLTVFVAVAGLKAGLLPIDTAYDVLTMQVALWLAVVSAIGAVVALISGAFSFRRSWLPMAAAVLVSAVTVVSFVREIQTYGEAIAHKADPDYRPGVGVSTDPADPLGFSASIMARRRAAGADPLVSEVGPNGCEIMHLPTQSAPGAAAYALQAAGFDIRDLGINRANGVHVSTWFDRTYDAAIRIRPGRTDVRVTPRDGAHDNGASCRLAKRILLELQPGR